MTPPDAGRGEWSPGLAGSGLRTVEVGRYALRVGDPAGAVIEQGAERDAVEGDAVAVLSDALEREKGNGKRRTPAEAGADLVDEASEATARVERAAAIAKGLAEGETLDLAQLGLEIGAVLGILEQLDSHERGKRALRLARSLSTLLLLLKRWAELPGVLRVALRAGDALGDNEAVAWARHELGTLEVVTGDVRGADRDLDEATKLREGLGDGHGRALTNRNLQFLCGQLRGMLRSGDLALRKGRLRRFMQGPALIIVVAAAVLAAGGVAGGFVGDGSLFGGGGDTATPGETSGSSSETSGGTSGTSGGSPTGSNRTNPGGGPTGTTPPESPTATGGTLPTNGNPPERSRPTTGPTGSTTEPTTTTTEPTESSTIKAPAYQTLEVKFSSEAEGIVTSSPTRIECGKICAAEFKTESEVVLTAKPFKKGSVEFSGCDASEGTQCLVTMDKTRVVTVAFIP